MIFGTVSASERIAPVQGVHPSERIRHLTFCGFSPGSSDERCSHHDATVAAHDHLAFLGEVERHDRNVFQVDVLPDVELGPVRKREDADAFARLHRGVVAGSTAPAADSSDPTGRKHRGRSRCAPWRAISLRRAARRRKPRRSCPRRAIEQRLRLEQAAALLRSQPERAWRRRRSLRGWCGRSG